ncbi:hypothetical protein BV22DRAFT_1037761 [Leucogyrophana mollusca]|uniref:Uncharacterized protein n=1 Tax=Leucogyrophana mollusca TaxID=85980 RepID=A0ACB8B8U4_9AGAM|nr:hypothetical protein BV22DRAFT_1037761 [Leucogyrophana mollusca]
MRQRPICTTGLVWEAITVCQCQSICTSEILYDANTSKWSTRQFHWYLPRHAHYILSPRFLRGTMQPEMQLIPLSRCIL